MRAIDLLESEDICKFKLGNWIYDAFLLTF